MTIVKNSRQLVFPFAHVPAMNRESFVRGQCNEAALDAVEAWRDWPQRMLILYGPEGSGKTHLSHIWAELAHAVLVDARNLTPDILRSRDGLSQQIAAAPALVIDKADEAKDETALFHLFNIAQELKLYVLFLSRRVPRDWPYGLEDVMSRARMLPAVELQQADDDVLRRILTKLLKDRQLITPPEVLEFVLARMERSVEFALRLAETIDQLSMENKKPVSRHLAAEALAMLLSREADQNLSNC